MKDVKETIKQIWEETNTKTGFWIANIIAIYISGFILIFSKFI